MLGPQWEIEPEAMQALEAYPWPGNIRQFINVLERAKILAEGTVVRGQDLPREVRSPTQEKQPLNGHTDKLEEIERAPRGRRVGIR
ncbi:MAG TPA: hypothetical protein VG125_05035 [Pirellulales bacterium]|nr:hypothetical protein [Pirellulales bacterium]